MAHLTFKVFQNTFFISLTIIFCNFLQDAFPTGHAEMCFSTSSKQNFERFCHNLFTSERGVVFWRRTSKPRDSISCRRWRKVKRLSKGKSATGVNTAFQKMTAGSRPVIVSVEIYSSATCPWNPVLSTSFVFYIHRDLHQLRDCQQRRGHFVFHQNDIILLAVPKNLAY